MLLVQLGINSTRDVWKFCQKHDYPYLLSLLENTCMQKPSPYWLNIIFSEYEELKVVVMVTR
jgi:hypothetical protein